MILGTLMAPPSRLLPVMKMPLREAEGGEADVSCKFMQCVPHCSAALSY